MLFFVAQNESSISLLSHDNHYLRHFVSAGKQQHQRDLAVKHFKNKLASTCKNYWPFEASQKDLMHGAGNTLKKLMQDILLAYDDIFTMKTGGAQFCKQNTLAHFCIVSGFPIFPVNPQL